MPKRAATPPIDDGAKYLTVVYPYPPRPNMEFVAHRKLFAQWVAACIDSRYLRAFYHKPTSPGSVILEVDDSMHDFKKILGTHKWSEFLADPGQEGHHVSKVFYCTYSSDREVQKNGWKRIDVRDNWFTNSSSKFVYPYPQTSWCDIPKIGNVIQNDLCRPLPGANFPPLPPPEPALTVCTPEWQEWKKTQEATRTVRAWARGTPPGSLNSASPSTASNSIPATRARSGSATPALQSVPRQAWSTATTGALAPPGLPKPSRESSSSSVSSRASSSSGSQNARSGPPSVRSVSPLEPQGSSSASSSVGPLSPASPNNHVIVAGDYIEHGLEDLALGGDGDDEDEYYSVVDMTAAGGDPQGFPLLDSPQVEYAVAKAVEVQSSLWSDYVPNESDDDDDDDDEKFLARAAEKNPVLCRVHNVVCKKGICKIYAAQLRDKVRKEREEERRQEREAAKNRSNKKGKKNSFFKDAPSPTSGGTPVARPPPPHLRSGAPPPSPGLVRQMPAHLMKGGSPAASSSPPPPPPSAGRLTPTPSRRGDDNDDARSGSSAGWETVSNGPWGPTSNANARNTRNAPASNKGNANAAAPSAAPKAWGQWGCAPSISASSVRRNNDSWSVSARDDPAPVPAPNPNSANDERDYDAQSVSGRSSMGWGTPADGPWGSTDAVRATRPGQGSKGARTKTLAEMDELDGKSVAASTVSGASWGNVSAGPW